MMQVQFPRALKKPGSVLSSKVWILLLSFLWIPIARLNAASMPLPSAHLPSTFEQNQGQAPAEVKWLGRNANYMMLFQEDGLTFLLPDKTNQPILGAGRASLHRPVQRKYNLIRMKLVGAHPWKNFSGLAPQSGVSNYLETGTAKNRIQDVPLFQSVKVSGVYDGIDLVFYTDGENLEYDFVLAPGADPSRIQLDFSGTKAMDVDGKSGDLVLTAQDGSQLRQHRPRVYQQAATGRLPVQAGYRVLGQGRAAFTLAPYDRSRPLIIDPTVDFTTFFGGNNSDQPTAIAVDAAGNTYITGGTLSTNFPVTDHTSFEKPKNFAILGFTTIDFNIFVAKLDPAGKLVFASYGGVGSGTAIAVDNSGAYVTGITYPPEGDQIVGFTDNSDGDAFVWRLDSQLGLKNYFRVIASTGTDDGTAIGVDSGHNAWVAGTSYIGQSSNNPRSGQMFVDVLRADGLVRSTYSFGSNGDDVPRGLAIGQATNDRAWITGKTCGNGFPTTDGINHELSHCAAFVLVLENTGVEDIGMVLGGSDGDDEGNGIVPNGPNSAYITGTVTSSNFPTTAGAFLTTKPAGSQGFVTQIDGTSGPGQIVHSTFFGADGASTPAAIANADGKGVYISGSTSSSHLPGGPVLAPNPSAGFVTKFSVDLSQVRYTQLLGLVVEGLNVVNSPAAAPQIYTTGFRYTGTHNSQHEDAFLVKLEEGTPTSSVTALPEQVDDPAFTIHWSGTDSASAIASYDIYVSDNGGAFTAFQTATAATQAAFNGTNGHTYGFFSVATDAAGNKEPMKSAPDTVVRVGPPPPISITCANCSFDIDGVTAATSFNVNTGNNSGTFTFDNGDTASPIHFSSTSITRTSVVGNFATVYGEGTLNGTPGYTFTLSATDAGGPGSGMDTILVQLFGPNNYTYNAPSLITTGDVVVQQ